MTQVNMSLRIDAELKDAFMAAAKSMDRNGSQLIRDLCARPLTGSIIPGSVTRLRQDVSNSGAAMCFPMTWSNLPLLHGGMK